MTQATKFDPRLAPLTQQVKSMANPQQVYYDKAGIRAEKSEGVWNLYRYEDILKVNRHPAVLGNGGQGGSFGHDAPLIPLEIDGEEHAKWRRILDPLFSPKQVALLEPQIRGLARDLIGKFASRGHAELHDEFCEPLPSLIFLRLFGAPIEDFEFFLEFKNGVIHPEGETVEEIEANMAVAGAKLVEYFINYLDERRKDTEEKNDVIGVLLRSEKDGKPIPQEDLINLIFLFMFAGLDTVTASMSCILAWLGQHPEERDRLNADRSLIPAAVEELLRYESPVPSGQRHIRAEIDLGDGLVLKPGDIVHAFWAAANVDPTHHKDPLTVNFDRERNTHMVFASGTHRCLGSHLARLELRLALDEIFDHIPDFVVEDPEKLVYDNVSVRTVQKLPVRFTPR
ncbi:cytochrome P450 family protein [Mycolicibacterium hassiacum DSM 44199]|mgnify:CR=1 FL=1|jgi:cytochrome P450|uniref:Cytochrome P450 family protein n=1 Tax=Mycolicibacterium hassiacum (strain DSM 44199 / CIP 105218 / JCM 12690 / 3849) TaxID=1122247 RepID=K5BES1_MYCHD|nr:cytochrome P450 [Mycolicibacterium hassiacum]EKF22556.1 cytochrome P450 family protein [Mycolicibacterium hassiacum DSM 44199]MDA4088735.1 cytochrome P450 [Mycolicibacterium hassiacum DSM 44199]PZN23281.1 MAG: cytochrome P450 [Mycolicibacterium hassiacum]VCT91465.1 Cytochrome P450(BM-1) [Mycolicibacterium hassiacum DSM 44199]